MNRNDAINELRQAYEQADFSREGKSHEARHENEIQCLKQELVDERQKTEGVSQYLDSLQTQIEALKKQLQELATVSPIQHGISCARAIIQC
jgi:uncharacterized protein involved in exopolysaccharide biosynthesis